MLTVKQIKDIVAEAQFEAAKAAGKFYAEKLGGVDQMSCGFAWVNIYSYEGKKLKGSTKMGKALKEAGVEQDWQRVFSIWNPSGVNVQNIDVKEVGAEAAAEVFTKYGFVAYAGSRMD